jgi:hypothetical protein
MTRTVVLLSGMGLALAMGLGGVSAASKGPREPENPKTSAAEHRPRECPPGKPCVCSGSEACEVTCVPDAKRPAKGCEFLCYGTGSCTFHCPEGGCSSRSNGPGATELTCEGGSCTMTCSGSGTCELNDCRSGCRLACNGAGVCENDCPGPGCSCAGKNCQ